MSLLQRFLRHTWSLASILVLLVFKSPLAVHPVTVLIADEPPAAGATTGRHPKQQKPKAKATGVVAAPDGQPSVGTVAPASESEATRPASGQVSAASSAFTQSLDDGYVCM